MKTVNVFKSIVPFLRLSGSNRAAMIRVCVLVGCMFFVLGTINVWAASQNATRLSIIGGGAYALDVEGEYAYMSEGVFLNTVDVSNPADPERISRLDLNDIVHTICTSGSLVFATIWGEDSFKIIDVSNPQEPFVCSAMDLNGFGNGVATTDTLAIVVCDGQSYVIDVSNPTDPTVLSSNDLSPGFSVDIQGAKAYIVDIGPGELKIFDISNPYEPVELGKATLPGQAYDVEVVGSYAYVASHGLTIVNISDPNNPSVVGHATSSGGPRHVSVKGSRAYLTNYEHHRVYIFDVTDPKNPSQLGFYESSIPWEVNVKEHSLVYFTDKDGGLKILNATNPANPVLIGAYRIVGLPVNLTADFPYLYAANLREGISIIDVSDPEVPNLVSTYDTPGSALDIERQGSLLFVADFESGLHILDMSDPTNLSLVGTIDTPGGVSSVTVFPAFEDSPCTGTFAYLGDKQRVELHIVDVSQPENPALVESAWLPDMPMDVLVLQENETYQTGDALFAYVANWDEGLQILDVTTPTQTHIVGSYTLEGQDRYYGVDVRDFSEERIAFLSSYYNDRGVRILNVSDPENPVSMSFFELWGEPHSISVSHEFAYVSSGSSGIRIVDVADPYNPTLGGFHDTFGDAVDLDVHGSMAYVSDIQGGVSLFRLSGARIKDAEILRHTIPEEMDGGETIRAEITVRNYGTLTWDEAVEILLSISNDPDFFFEEVSPMWDIPEGEVILLEGDYTFEVGFTAPRKSGEYSFNLQMSERQVSVPGDSGKGGSAVQSGVLEYFGQPLTVNVKINFTSAQHWLLYE